MANPDLAKLESIARECRVQIIRMLTHAGSGHPGGSLSVIDILTTLFFNRMRYDPKRPGLGGPRPLRALQGPLRAGAVLRAWPARATSRGPPHHPAQARQPAPGASRPRRAARHRGRDRLARPGPVDRDAAWRSGSSSRGTARARLLRPRRRRDPGGPGVGGGHVRAEARRARPSARQPLRDPRLQQDPARRLREEDPRPRAGDRQVARRSAGRCSRSTATTSPRSTRRSTRRRPPRAAPRSSWPTRQGQGRVVHGEQSRVARQVAQARGGGAGDPRDPRVPSAGGDLRRHRAAPIVDGAAPPWRRSDGRPRPRAPRSERR